MGLAIVQWLVTKHLEVNCKLDGNSSLWFGVCGKWFSCTVCAAWTYNCYFVATVMLITFSWLRMWSLWAKSLESMVYGRVVITFRHSCPRIFLHNKGHTVLKDDDWWHGRNTLLLGRIEFLITDDFKYLDAYTYLQIAFFGCTLCIT